MKEEQVDVVHAGDEIVAHATRKECHKHGLRHRIVHVIITQGDKVYVQRRSTKKDIYPGYYEASLSGHVRRGESYEQAAKRELKEELGVKQGRLKKLGTFVYETRKEHAMCAVFLLQDYQGEITLDKEEVASGTWRKTLPQKLTPGTKYCAFLL
ncbi:MAG: NUDIX domain-containing protein [Candidatus Woesearchaeota archaeon]|jgi:isopentenyldiphosphate isomerase|nr:NUDIX domain-containing protein [Candidatus Woesearchaeota archaeon]MDP7198219.1 NUDIX domain-containing protein [Candidatus Woesearchaeota archaeon]MDP7467055.1 NUDIX domain-containing protein [Candidatus Woesearchaeota archaeon]MDP7646723.1 NUDIX domain-containing protein [Candidatus Woesearchaeota archaeon]|tara:strand:- start:60 stop:521 length:462 start_codon:yes stop_codon:yes gene_type:complete